MSDVRDTEIGQIGSAELKDPGRQGKEPAVGSDVPELLEREQEAPGGSTGQPGLPGHVGECSAGSRSTQCADDEQSAFERLNMVSILARS